MQVRQDFLSIALTTLGIAVGIFVLLFIQNEPFFITLIILGITGMLLSIAAVKEYDYDEYVSSSEAYMILAYGVSAALVLILLGTVVSLPKVFALPRYMNMLAAVLIAAAEEQFFRAGLMNLFLSRFSALVAILTTSFMFGLYHMAVYGSEPTAILLTTVGGAVLGFIAVATGRVSTSIVGHMIYNFIAALRTAA